MGGIREGTGGGMSGEFLDRRGWRERGEERCMYGYVGLITE